MVTSFAKGEPAGSGRLHLLSATGAKHVHGHRRIPGQPACGPARRLTIQATSTCDCRYPGLLVAGTLTESGHRGQPPAGGRHPSGTAVRNVTEDDRYRHTRQARHANPRLSSRTAGCSTHSGGSGHAGRSPPCWWSWASWSHSASRSGQLPRCGDLTLTSRLSQLQVRCPPLPPLPRRERQARLWPASALQSQAIGPVPAKIVVPLARSCVRPAHQEVVVQRS